METGTESGCDTAQQSQKLLVANPNVLCRKVLCSALTDPAVVSQQLVEQAVSPENGRTASLGLLQVIEWTCTN